MTAMPSGYERIWREITLFTKRVAFGMGPGPLGQRPQTMNAVGIIGSLSSPLSSLTTGAAIAYAGTLSDLGTLLQPYTFNTAGRVMRIRISGTTAANGNTKVLQLLFGTATIQLFSNAANNKDFCFDVVIYATGINTQQINITGYANNALVTGQSTTATQTTTNALQLAINLPTSTGAADVVVNEFTVYGES